MNLISKKYFILLVGLLFVTAATIDPLHHEHLESDHSHSKVECQFCESEVFTPIQSNISLAKISLSAIFLAETSNEFISDEFNIFSPRAPPKI